MSVIYIREQGTYLKVKGERLAVQKGNETILEIPFMNIENLMVFGNVQITSQAMQKLLLQGSQIDYFTRSGSYIGHACSEESKNIFLRLAQYEVYNDLPRRMGIAKAIVSNKIYNQIQMITQYRWEEKFPWKEQVQALEENRKKLELKETSNSIMGIEGICSNIYFSVYGKMFKSEICFETRNRRPPKDPVNAILSLGYTFLTKDMCVLLEGESFETYLGFLHGVRYGRKSLALDLIEEFRQPAIDRLVLHLFNKNILGKYDFEEENQGILLNKEGFGKFCREYEKWMTEAVLDGKSYRVLMKQQVANLKNAISHGEDYVTWRLL